MAQRWYVVQVRSRTEVEAGVAIARHGIETFIPVMQKLRRHNHQIEVVTVPRYPPYMFARFDGADPSWPEICHGECKRAGVVRVLCDSEHRPRAVPERAMDAVRAFQPPAPGEQQVPYEFAEGQPVLVYIAGKAQQAVYVEGGRSRAFVRLWILGAQRLIEVVRSSLEPAEDILTKTGT